MARRRTVIAGNWKMFKTAAETARFFEELRPAIGAAEHCDVVVCPPYPALTAAVEAAAGSPARIGAQNLFWEDQGAFTGEVSGPMLAAVGCEYVIVGHSERRQYFGETDESVARRVGAALRAKLTPIVCVGETVEEREAGRAEEVLKRQFEGALGTLTEAEISHILMAYEPVWAIGTGRTATPELASQAHAYLRRLAAAQFGEAAASALRILYGGSVKPVNAPELLENEEIDGALVGGASLEAASFAAIVGWRG